ncbi:dienelactone hydrolase family protein [Dactylosporangium sp. CA-139114]|uniref:dienelactone hydrolase family protein n=1 Tax=Dactylosporangium sp. CA-139114 TaxID=3239931 RepID=UPI003D98F658
MAEVVLFHHLLGLTGGVRAFADGLRANGHTVHTPDLFGGARPATLEAGAALAASLEQGSAPAAPQDGGSDEGTAAPRDDATLEATTATQHDDGSDEVSVPLGERSWEEYDGMVYAGISWGVMTAQRLAQTRPGARGALLVEACLPVTGEWAIGPWPDGVPVQIHGMDADPFFAGEGDIDAARELVGRAGDTLAQLYVYEGDKHLFTDSSLPSYDAAATALVLERALAFLAGL